MLLDVLTLAAVVEELRSSVVGARVQDVVQPHALAVSLELYLGRRSYLNLTAEPKREGLTLDERRPRRGEGPARPMLLALKARALGSRLASVEQLPLERVLVLTFEGTRPVRLVAELTGRMANLVLVDSDERVIAVARPVTPEMTRARVVLPGRPYEAPPPQSKTTLDAVTAAAIEAWLTGGAALQSPGAAPTAEAPGGEVPDSRSGPAAGLEDPEAVARTLVRHVRGLSPLAARETVARAARLRQASGIDTPHALAAALTALTAPISSRSWSPSVAMQSGSVVAYAPYRLTHLDHPTDSGTTVVEDVASITRAIGRYEEARGTVDPYAGARSAVAGEIEVVRDRVRRRAAALERERLAPAEVERLRESADLILAYQYLWNPGAERLETPPPDDGPPRSIALDPAVGPVENAKRYYERYHAKRRALDAYGERMAEIEAQLATLDQLDVDLALAEDRPGIDAAREALRDAFAPDGTSHGAAADRDRSRKRASRSAHGRSASAGKALELYSSDGIRVLVGRNSRQNEIVTFDRASRGDLWLHARSVPGGHVVVKAAGREVPETTVREAAALAAYYSAARDDTRVDVVVADIRHVRRMRSAGPGMVTYSRERTLSVDPAGPEELGLA